MIDFTKVPNIHYWTQRVLPCVFDESLSYVEKINKLEEEINNLIEDYNTFGQAVTNEINTFEGETTNQINVFVTQVTDDINSFKENVTNNINSFETDIRNIVEEFETAINNDIATFKQTITTQVNAMQEVIDDIPNTVTTQVNAITQPWLVENVPAMVESSVANNVNKFFDVDQLYNSGTSETIGDINNWTETGIYFGTTNSEFLNFPDSVGAGYNFWCIVGHSADTSVNNPLQQNLYISNGNMYYRSQSDTQEWNNWHKSNISVTIIPYNTTIDFNTYFYTSTEVANGDMWIATFQDYTKWLNAPSGFKAGDIALITNDILYDGGTVVTVERVTKIGSKAIDPQYIGKTWSRCKVGSTWKSWSPKTLDYQYKEILTNTQLNNLTETGIYTVSSESGVTIGGTIPTDLETGNYYIQTVANSDNEIIQTIVNGGNTGNSLYTRMKYGSNWGEWQGISRRELLWSGVATVTNPKEYADKGHTHIETSGITDVEISNTSNALSEFVASHEVIVSVSNESTIYINPPVTTGYTFGVTTDEITGKNVVKINVVLESMLSGPPSGTGYYVSYKLYKVN